MEPRLCKLVEEPGVVVAHYRGRHYLVDTGNPDRPWCLPYPGTGDELRPGTPCLVTNRDAPDGKPVMVVGDRIKDVRVPFDLLPALFSGRRVSNLVPPDAQVVKVIPPVTNQFFGDIPQPVPEFWVRFRHPSFPFVGEGKANQETAKLEG